MDIINTKEALRKLKTIRCFALDMDGTFYLGDRLLDGALDFYNIMQSRGVSIVFMTNNSSHDRAYYVEKLQRMGCNATDEQIYTSGMAACQYLRRVYPGKKVWLLGNAFLRRECLQYGILLTDEDPDVVLVGFDTTLDYEKMTRVCDYIRSGLPYIATHPDFNCPVENGFIPDIGAIMAFIEASTGRKADVVIGKPNAPIVDGLMEMTGMQKEEICICGDRLYTDIATGVRHGLLSVCVLTGEATPEDIAVSKIRPALVFPRLKDVAVYLECTEMGRLE